MCFDIALIHPPLFDCFAVHNDIQVGGRCGVLHVPTLIPPCLTVPQCMTVFKWLGAVECYMSQASSPRFDCSPGHDGIKCTTVFKWVGTVECYTSQPSPPPPFDCSTAHNGIQVVGCCGVLHVPTLIPPRTAVFKWLGAVAVTLPKSQLSALLPHLMTSLVREMMVVEPSGDELRRLAKDVGDVMRRRVGTEEYTRQLARLQAQLEARRTGRKSKRAQEVITDPERAAKRKIKKHLKKKDFKKKKFDVLKGRKPGTQGGGKEHTAGDVLREAFDSHVDHLLSELHPTSKPFLQYPDVVDVVHVSPIRGQCHELDSADSKWRESLDKRIDEEFEVLTIFSEKNEEVTKVKDCVSALEITTSLHDAMLNELNHFSRINNIIIDGLPKVTDECVVDLVIKLGLELGVKVEPMDIDTAHRLQAKKSNVPSIIVKFTQRSLKESLLLNKHKLNHVNFTKLANVAGHPLYISEHLIPLNNLWFYQARKPEMMGLINIAIQHSGLP
uniref:U3 small nucleolar RNA-associated protein 20 C-terminal domain-containing protein n=1 Tax=Timema bartmani TaxID=61472 RepID=A0A7R9EVJ5_9NEOP|nr:unnamed protein product [Timema bartmani]